MLIEDTCTPKCAYYERFTDADGNQRCPHYIQTTWQSDDVPGPKTVEDCATKRAVILQIDAFNRMLGLQQAAEQERNLQHKMLVALVEVANNHSLPRLSIDDAEVLQIEEPKDDENNGQ
ncbi:MAG: hypothetical protein ACYS32_00635 [Planctomycetota bacterium]|jgi:hypothetical protein